MTRAPAPGGRRSGSTRRTDRPSPAPWLRLDGPSTAADPRWITLAGWVLVASVSGLLAWLAFGLHVVGDYFTESDFYGGYAEGARMVQQGHLDPARHGVYGPLYEIVLALVGYVARDLFTAARLLSIASSATTLALTFVLLARRTRPAVGLWTVAFLGANAVFLRYGFSATTDAMAVALQTGAIFAMVAWQERRAPVLAGFLTALATLTRYSAVALVPAAIAIYLWRERPRGTSRRRAITEFVAGFGVLLLPWLAFSLARGHLPGEQLITHFAAFYANPDASRNVQDLPVADPALGALRDVAAAARLAQPGLLHNLMEHVRLDLTALIGAPVAMFCGLGLLLAVRDRLWRGLASYWLASACLFAALLPIFYSDRYALPYLPAYLSLAGIAAGSPRVALLARGISVPLKWAIALVPLLLAGQASQLRLRDVLSQMPVETLATGQVLRAQARPGSRVLSRKGHIGYYSGVPTVAFPRVATIPALATYCRARGVDYIYFSWYEAELRPEFWALLDTSRVLPGLSVVYATDGHPAVLYRIGTDFGVVPAWFANDTLRRVQEARAELRVLPDARSWAPHLVLGIDANRHGDPQTALGHLREVVRYRPDLAEAWIAIGEAEARLQHTGEASDALGRALAIEPANTAARIRLGALQLSTGQVAAAAETWRPIVPLVRHRAVLQQMLPVYVQTGDASTAALIRAALAAAP